MGKIGIVIWSKLPTTKCKSKTRLALQINNQKMADKLTLLMLEFLLFKLSKDDWELFLFYQDENIHKNDYSLFETYNIKDSFKYDNRLSWMENTARSLEILQEKGFDKAIAIVSDCPFIDSLLVQEAILKLNFSNYVFNVAIDKGINLYGINKNSDPHNIQAINTISRSPNYNLINEIIINLTNKGMSYNIIKPTLSDVDQIQDVKLFYEYLQQNKNNSAFSKYDELLALTFCISNG